MLSVVAGNDVLRELTAALGRSAAQYLPGRREDLHALAGSLAHEHMTLVRHSHTPRLHQAAWSSASASKAAAVCAVRAEDVNAMAALIDDIELVTVVCHAILTLEGTRGRGRAPPPRPTGAGPRTQAPLLRSHRR